MVDVVLKARDGTDVTYPGVEKVRLLLADGSSKDFEDKEASGTGSVNTDKPIRFYDPYGEILYAYTREEALALTELPPGPVLSGLTFDRWTHTLEEVQETMYFADVGPMYKSDSTPVTVLIIETLSASTSVTVYLDMWVTSYKATIGWGDGSTSSVTGSSSSTRSSSHTFAAAGIHIITVTVNSGLANLGSAYSSTYRGVLGTSISNNTSTVVGTPSYELLSVLIGSYQTSSYPVCVEVMACNQRLRFVSTYNRDERYAVSKKYFQCPSLKVIAGNTAEKMRTTKPQVFYGDTGLRRNWVSGDVPEDTFTCCDSLEEVMYDVTSIADATMNSKWTMLMLTETPPTISASSRIWGTKPIYVPDAALETYKTADGWSSVADYILPASEYPDE